MTAQIAIRVHIKDLPNVGNQANAVVGKSALQKLSNGLIQSWGPIIKQLPTHDLLANYVENGCPVDFGPNCTKSQPKEALKMYGAHPSAFSSGGAAVPGYSGIHFTDSFTLC